jgi:hypothetical protein
MDGGLKCYGNPQLKNIQEHFVIFGSGGRSVTGGVGVGLRVLLRSSPHTRMHVLGPCTTRYMQWLPVS